VNNAYNAATYGAGGGGSRYGGTGGNGGPGVVIITYFTQTGLPTNYTATAPLSMTGTTLAIAAATSNAPGVVQVGSGLSVSSGVVTRKFAAGWWYLNANVTGPLGTTVSQWTVIDTPVNLTLTTGYVPGTTSGSIACFQASIAGWYQFSFMNMNASNNAQGHMGLYRYSNSSWLCIVDADPAWYYSPAGFCVACYLNVNDYISPYVQAGTVVGGAGSYYNSITGYYTHLSITLVS